MISRIPSDRLRDMFEGDCKVDVLYLFGSYSKGKATPISDVDFAVLLNESVPESDYFQLRLHILTDLMSAVKSSNVELVVLNAAPILLAFKVIASRNIIVENNAKHRVRFEASTINRYLDLRPLFGEQRFAVKTQIAEGRFFG